MMGWGAEKDQRLKGSAKAKGFYPSSRFSEAEVLC